MGPGWGRGESLRKAFILGLSSVLLVKEQGENNTKWKQEEVESPDEDRGPGMSSSGPVTCFIPDGTLSSSRRVAGLHSATSILPSSSSPLIWIQSSLHS